MEAIEDASWEKDRAIFSQLYDTVFFGPWVKKMLVTFIHLKEAYWVQRKVDILLK